MNAQGGLDGFEKAWLDGNTRLAELNFAKARTEIASTGRPDLVAKAELIRCAAHLAALDMDTCPAYEALAGEAATADRTYAAFLAGQWQGLDVTHLPTQYVPLAKATDSHARTAALEKIEPSLSRLIAAGILLRKGDLSPEGIVLATETASKQGWRRPLLAWLKVQLKRAEDSTDREALARIHGRIELVESSLARN